MGRRAEFEITSMAALPSGRAGTLLPGRAGALPSDRAVRRLVGEK